MVTPETDGAEGIFLLHEIPPNQRVEPFEARGSASMVVHLLGRFLWTGYSCVPMAVKGLPRTRNGKAVLWSRKPSILGTKSREPPENLIPSRESTIPLSFLEEESISEEESSSRLLGELITRELSC